METTIKQIIAEEWTGSDGKKRTDIIGLGEDNMVYKWHMATGRWIANILNK